MRQRLLVAILLVVIGALVLASLGGLYFVRRASISTALQQLTGEAHVLAESPIIVAPADRNARLSATSATRLRTLRIIGNYSSLQVVGLAPDGSFTGTIQEGLPADRLRPDQLNDGRTVSGNAGDLVFVAIPLALTPKEKARVNPPVPLGDTAVLLATRTVRPVGDGIGYYFLVALAALAVAAAVAYWLANRFSRPLVTAAEVTARIAGGDLEARMPDGNGDLPEFRALAGAINQMGDRLSRARDQQRQFLLSVSHDLRTPLTSIRGYAEAVADGTTDDVAGAMAVIVSETERLERLVQDLLDLARLDARRFTLDLQPVDVDTVVALVVERFDPVATSAALTLRAGTRGPAPLTVTADPDRLVQILANLIENAVTFATATVTLATRLEGSFVLITVDDDGQGIDARDLPHVFEPHFSSDRSRVGRRQGGTGLGLAIVAELASIMGGGVRAESPTTEGGGTRMTLWFPAGPPAGPPGGSAGRAVAAGTPA